MSTATKSDGPVTIKKYANRRLYNTGTSTYVTLEDLATMVKSGEDFAVVRRQDRRGHHALGADPDHLRAGEQGRRQNLLPINFLRQLIRFYGDSHADAGAALSRRRRSNRSPASRRSSASRCRRRSASAPFGALDETGAAQHGNVPARVLDVHAVRAARGGSAAPEAEKPAASSGERSRRAQAPALTEMQKKVDKLSNGEK